MRLANIEAVSGLAFFFERKSFFQQKHLIVGDLSSIDKLKAFLQFKKTEIPWYELAPFPPAKSPFLEKAIYKRKRWQAMAQAVGQGGVFLASPQALLKKTNTQLSYFVLKKGNRFDYEILNDYNHKEFVEKEGEFSSRSFLIDIFSPVYNRPFRLELLGETIQSIHLLDNTFKKREEELEQALVSSLYEWSFKGEDRKKLCHHLRQEEQKLDTALPLELFENFSKGKLYFGFESLLSCLDQTCSLDFFSDLSQIWIINPEKTAEHFFGEQLKLKKEYPFFSPENLFLPWEKLEKKEQDISKTEFALDAQKNLKKIARFKKSKNIKKDLKDLPVSTLVFAGSHLKELKKLLLKEGVLSSLTADFFDQKSLIFIEKPIKESFMLIGDTAYLRDSDFIIQKKQNLNFFDTFRKRARALEFSKLEIGDLLVHRQHGVGEFKGLQALKLKDKKEDFIVLCYK
ncbi:MAG: hypothetical protein OXN83_03860, partial [Oligoflexia bacterium]|nr:hypothetical protein [Oligoflexia bacterium]